MEGSGRGRALLGVVSSLVALTGCAPTYERGGTTVDPSSPPADDADAGGGGSDAGTPPITLDDSGPPPDSSGPPPDDSGPPPPVDAGPPDCARPTGGWGTRVGTKFAPITLEQCDGAEYEFYGDDFCSARFTVVDVVAGWCSSCVQDAIVMEDALNAAYIPRGVRVIQTILQDEDSNPPSRAFCSAWVDRYGLSNIELLDPDMTTLNYSPWGSIPVQLIVDSSGTIVWLETGGGDGFYALTSKLDRLLAGS